MNDPRFRIPPSPRRIAPSLLRQAAFLALGALAAAVRGLTAPWRHARLPQTGVPTPVILLEPFGMGDVLALQPLARAWCEAGHPVVAGVRAEWQPLLVPHPNLTCLDLRPSWASADVRRKYRGFWSGPRGLFTLARALRPLTRGARGIDVRGDVRSLLLLYAAGCDRVETLARYYTANDCRVFPGAARRRPIDPGVERWRLNAVFAPQGGPALAPPSVAHLRAAPDAAGAARDPARVALVPLTPWDGKRWTPDAWQAVALGLRARGAAPVVLCGPGESAAAARETGGGLPAEACADVRDWVQRLDRGGAAVCVNTGPMHLAAALDLALVVIEGSSRLPLWAPSSRNARVVHHQDQVPCAPCHQVGDAAQRCGRRCMARVLPGEILRAYDELRPPRTSSPAAP